MANDLSAVPSRKLFVLCGYAVLAGAFGCFAVLPYGRAMREAKADVARFQEEIRLRDSRRRELDGVRARVNLIDLQTRDYDRLVPVNQDQGPFLTELSSELDKTGMRDLTVSAMQPTALGKSQRLPIEIHGKGTFPQFHDFLVRLENLSRRSSVGKITIEADTEMAGYVAGHVVLYIYNRKAE